MTVHSILEGRAAGRISAPVVALALALADTPVRAAEAAGALG